MSDLPLVLIYKPLGRDVAPLSQVCANDLYLSLQIVNNEGEFREIVQKNNVSCIIMPFTSDESGRNNICEFVEVASRVLQPEDADLKIIYTTNGPTPAWPWPPNLDPMPIKNHDERPYAVTYLDNNWKDTIDQLKFWKDRFSSDRNRRRGDLKFVINNAADVPFPSEAKSLLRAAFKDMSAISIEFPDQGLSGSIACFVKPSDAGGQKCKELFVKIFSEHNKANEELAKIRDFIEPYIDYPRILYSKRYQGIGYSLIVTDRTKGSDGQSMTFSKVIRSKKFSKKFTERFIAELVALLGSFPHKDEPMDLIDAYLHGCLTQDKKRLKLESDNKCYHWFGHYTDGLNIIDKIRQTFERAGIQSTVWGICHGDLHSGNILLKKDGVNARPDLVDYSRAGRTHAIKDIVTIETDMIIRGLSGIRVFESDDQIVFWSFLDSLHIQRNLADFNMSTIKTKLELSQAEKVRIVIEAMRKFAFTDFNIREPEYLGALILKTLEVLSYGTLPNAQNQRATSYVSYLIERIKSFAK